MQKFDYTFINSDCDQKIYTKLLNSAYKKEHGYTIHDNDDNYKGFHSTLVCKHDKIIIGGICAYVSDDVRINKLPMEWRGIELKKYIDLRNMRYAEICRGAVLKEYRKYNIYSELMKRCLKFCMRIGCGVGVWVARQHQAKYYENELSLMGLSVKNLGVIKHTHMGQGNKPIEIEYYLCALLSDSFD